MNNLDWHENLLFLTSHHRPSQPSQRAIHLLYIRWWVSLAFQVLSWHGEGILRWHRGIRSNHLIQNSTFHSMARPQCRGQPQQTYVVHTFKAKTYQPPHGGHWQNWRIFNTHRIWQWIHCQHQPRFPKKSSQAGNGGQAVESATDYACHALPHILSIEAETDEATYFRAWCSGSQIEWLEGREMPARYHCHIKIYRRALQQSTAWYIGGQRICLSKRNT